MSQTPFKCGLLWIILSVATATSGRSDEVAIYRGRTYSYNETVVCNTLKAVYALKAFRENGDLTSLPAGCGVGKIEVFVPYARVPNSTMPSKRVAINPNGARLCKDLQTGEEYRCDVSVMETCFIEGNALRKSDNQYVKVWIESPNNVYVADPP